MNGCYGISDKEISQGRPDCEHYDNGKCKHPEDTVNRYDGQPICPKHPKSISRGDYEARKHHYSS